MLRSTPRIEVNQRSREARLRLERVERLIVVVTRRRWFWYLAKMHLNGSLLTPRWREMDSNHQSLAVRLDAARPENVASVK